MLVSGWLATEGNDWMASKGTKIVETQDFANMMGRMLRAWGQRVENADTYDLAELVEFGVSYQAELTRVIRAGHERDPEGWSWTRIGDELGISRQAARQRWMRPSPH